MLPFLPNSLALAMTVLVSLPFSSAFSCYNDAGDDVPCTCQCSEDPSYSLGSVHPYRVGQAVWCYADESQPGLGQTGPVGCFIEVNLSDVLCGARDKCVSVDEGCFCCDTNCG
jgi:hypothetical protein